MSTYIQTYNYKTGLGFWIIQILETITNGIILHLSMFCIEQFWWLLKRVCWKCPWAWPFCLFSFHLFFVIQSIIIHALRKFCAMYVQILQMSTKLIFYSFQLVCTDVQYRLQAFINSHSQKNKSLACIHKQ